MGRFASAPESAIERRVEDSVFLWSAGRRQSALLLVLVAVAARASRAYPKLRDRTAFVSLLRSSIPMRLSVEYRGSLHPVEELLYRWLRNTLVHEGGLPADIEISDEYGAEELVVRAGGAPEYVLKLSPAWFDLLTRVALAGACADQLGQGGGGAKAE